MEPLLSLLEVVGVLLLVGMLPLGMLTMLGARRRGLTWSRAVLAAVGYPVTWVAWYARDVRPYASARHP